MDNDLRKALEDLKVDMRASVEGSHKVLKESIDATRQASVESHEATRRQIAELNGRVSALWKFIHGSDPPPPPPGIEVPDSTKATVPPLGDVPSLPPVAPVDEQLPDLHQKIAQLKVQMIGLRNEVVETKELTKTQTSAMGIPPKGDQRSAFRKAADFGIWLLKSREGQKFVLSALAAIGAIITVVGNIYASMHGRPLPMPDYPSSAYAAPSSPVVDAVAPRVEPPVEGGSP